MKKFTYVLSIIITASILIFSVNSCVDPLYDLNDGIDPTVKIGGDVLGIPLGKMDTVFLKNIVNPDSIDFVQLFEDGGYGICLSDSFTLEDLLNAIDGDQLKFDIDIPSITQAINFEEVDITSFTIPQFTDALDVGLNLPDINLGDIMPEAIQLNEQVDINFDEYSLAGVNSSIADQDYDVNEDGFLQTILPDLPNTTHPEFDIPQQNLDIHLDPINLIYSINTPDSVRRIDSVILENGAIFEVELYMEGAEDALVAGYFTPDISLEVEDDIFEFLQFGLNPDKITFDNNNELNKFNNYRSKKSVPIAAIRNLPLAENGQVDINKLISVVGDIAVKGTVKANGINDAKDINLHVSASIKDMEADYMIFDLQNIRHEFNEHADISISKENIPEEITVVNTLHFGSAETYLEIKIFPTDLPPITNAVYRIESMDIEFPKEFDIYAPGYAIQQVGDKVVCKVSDQIIDPVSGKTIKVYLREIDLSEKDIDPIFRSISIEDEIKITGAVCACGKINSKQIDYGRDYRVDLDVDSNIELQSITVTTKDIAEYFETETLILQHEVDTGDSNINYLGTVKVKPGSFLSIEMNKPNFPVPFLADNIKLMFSDIYVFNDSRLDENNHLIINGEIPDRIDLEVKELRINKELSDGKITVIDEFRIEGGYILQGNIPVNSKDIEGLDGKQLSFTAIVPAMEIESVSVGLNSLEADFESSTDINFELDDIPSLVSSLDSIMLGPDAAINLEVIVHNLPDLGNSPIKADIKIQLPDILELDSDNINSEGELHIRKNIEDGTFSHSEKIKGFIFDGSPLEGKLEIDEEVNFKVKVSVENPTIDLADLSDDDISVEVNVSLVELRPDRVYGKFDLSEELQENASTLSFESLPEYMRSENVVLDVENPLLMITTENNLGLPLGVDLILQKYSNGETAEEPIVLPFRMDKSDSPLEFVQNKLWIASSDEGMPSDYTFVETHINKLLVPIPDSVSIDFKPIIDSNTQHVIDLQADYAIKFNYDMSIPFKFGKDFRIVYKDTMAVDFGFREEMDMDSGVLELVADVANSIPLNLEMVLRILDKNDRQISYTESQTITAGNRDGSANKSKIAIRIAESLRSIQHMEKIVIEFGASSDATVAGTPIKPENFIVLELTAKITDGLTITIPLDNEEEQ